MERAEIEAKVSQAIADQLSKPLGSIRMEDSVLLDYGLKSHDMILLSATLQSTLGIKIPYTEVRKTKTVKDWVDLVEMIVKKH